MTTKSKSLAERMQRIEQKRARVAQDEAKLREDERKARTQRLIRAGALVEKVGLLDLDANAFYGALRSLQGGAADKCQVELWAADGGQAFAEEARRGDKGKEACVIVFSRPLSKEAAANVRRAGFRFSKVFTHWEGRACFEDAQSLAAAYGGVARRVDEDRARANPLTANEGDVGVGKGRAANGGGDGYIPPAPTDQSSLFGEDHI